MRRVLWLFLFGLAISAQGAADWIVSDATNGVLTISEERSPKRWTLDLTKLSLPEFEDACGPEETCFGRFVRNWELVEVDAARRLLYFTLVTGNSRNPPRVFLQYNLTTGRARSLAVAHGSWMDEVKISPNGRYLAYISGYHWGLGCPPMSGAEVLDVQTGKLAGIGGWAPSDPPAVVNVQSVKWVSTERLALEATVYDGQCLVDDSAYENTPEGKSKRQIVNAGALRYR